MEEERLKCLWCGKIIQENKQYIQCKDGRKYCDRRCLMIDDFYGHRKSLTLDNKNK